MIEQPLNRREFLKILGIASGALITAPVFGNIRPQLERTLRFYNLHTDERKTFTYWSGGRYIPEALNASIIFCVISVPKNKPIWMCIYSIRFISYKLS